MAKKTSYNEKAHEELVLELAKLRGSLRDLSIEKMKSGKAKEYRTARKNIARVLTAMRAKAPAAVQVDPVVDLGKV
jgi:ribosomal protein L29